VSNGYISLITHGLAANRPAPVTPVDPYLPSDLHYYETDTGRILHWTGAAWVLLGTEGSQGTIAAPIIPSTTHTIAGGTAIKFGLTIAASANAGDALTLPTNAFVGQEHLVYNNGAATASVYPGTATDVIDAVAAGGLVTLTNAKYALFICASNVAGVCTWVSFGGAGHSA
jgi:hypothetical protein